MEMVNNENKKCEHWVESSFWLKLRKMQNFEEKMKDVAVVCVDPHGLRVQPNLIEQCVAATKGFCAKYVWKYVPTHPREVGAKGCTFHLFTKIGNRFQVFCVSLRIINLRSTIHKEDWINKSTLSNASKIWDDSICSYSHFTLSHSRPINGFV